MSATATLPVLHPEHAKYLEERGITPATAAANGLRSARPQDLSRLAGRPVPENTSALEFPYLTLEGEDPFIRLRWFPPLRDREGREVKFTQPPGTSPRLYLCGSVRAVLPDPGIPLLIVEGETRALVAAQHGRAAIAIGGLWSWLREGKPIAALDAIAWADREVMLGGDSDVWVRPDLLQAVYALGKELERRGGKVRVAIIRPAPDGTKRGLDDLVAAEGAEALDGLTAIPLTHKAFTGAGAWWKGWAARKEEAAGPPAHETLGIADVAPWDDVVDGDALLQELLRAIRRFVVLPKHADIAAVLWVAAAHAHAAWDVFPLLAVTSPTKRCGKTTLLDVLRLLLPRPLLASNVSPAAVYRAIEAWHPSLLVDEADTFLTGNEELRGVLNSSHARATAFVLRVEGEGEERTVTAFSTWCPQVIARIGSLPPTLEDRSILLRLRRKTKAERVERARRRALEGLRDLSRRAARWVEDNRVPLEGAAPGVPDDLDDRAADNWHPLLAVADLAGGSWPVLARMAALALSAGRDAGDDEVGVRLLRHIRQVFEDKAVAKIPSVELVSALISEEEWGWATWRKGRPLDQRGLARLLGPFGVSPQVIRVGEQTPRGYGREQFSDAWARYMALHPQQAQQLNENTELGPLFDPQHWGLVADAKSHVTTEKQIDVALVADKSRGAGAAHEEELL